MGTFRWSRFGDRDLLAFSAIPCWDLMSPPELPGNTPVSNVVHPFKISFFPGFWGEGDVTVFDRFDRRFGQRFNFDKPLLGDNGFRHCFATLTETYFVGMGFGL